MNFIKRTLLTALAVTPFYTLANDTNIEHLIVSGTRSEQPTVEIPASIQIVTAEQIKLSGATNVAQVLNSQAGIQINDNIGNLGRGTTVSMRGFGDNSANNVLIMIDGRKLNTATLAPADLSALALSDVERIEIIQGSAGALYGDQATGGVINIITKSPDELSGNIEVAIGSDNLTLIKGSLSQGFDNGLSYRVSLEDKDAENYRDNNDNEQSNLLANLAYKKETFSLFLEAGINHDDLRYPGSLNSQGVRENRKQTLTPDDFSNREVESYRVGGSYNFTKEWALLGEYTDTNNESEGFIWGGDFKQSTKSKSFEPRVTGNIDTRLGTVIITTGVDLKDIEYQSTATGSDIEQEGVDYYGQIVIPATENLKITLGARQSTLNVENNIIGNKYDDDINVFQVGGAYQINENSRLFLRRDEGFRWPNIDENGFTAPGVEFLKPQTTTSWELGTETRFDTVFLSAVLYNLEAKDEIIYDPTEPNPNAWFGFGANINIDESVRKGIVLNSTWDATEKFQLQINYSYVDAELTSGTYKGNTTPFVAESTANIAANYAINNQWSIYADAQYTGERYPAADQANLADKLSGYTVINANIRWDNQMFYSQLRLSNLTGKEYNSYSGGVPPYDYNYPAAEQTYQLSFGYNF
jgi:iron complex outermembrane receptor protein